MNKQTDDFSKRFDAFFSSGEYSLAKKVNAQKRKPSVSVSGVYQQIQVKDADGKRKLAALERSLITTSSPVEVSNLANSLLEERLDLSSEIKKVKANAKLVRELTELGYKLGVEGKTREEAEARLEQEISEKGIPRTLIENKFYLKHKRGFATWDRTRHPPRLSSDQVKMLSGGGAHPNFIGSLKPSTHWTFAVDETGEDFSGGNDRLKEGNHKGKIALLMIPDEAVKNLPDLHAGWHGVDELSEEISHAAENFLKSGAAVLGIEAEAVGKTNRSTWFASIELLVELALRLMPIDGPTSISLQIEQRGKEMSAQNNIVLKKAMDRFAASLSRFSPERAGLVSWDDKTSGFISKSGRFDGYADMVAFVWGGGSASKLLADTRWQGPCLLEYGPRETALVIEALDLVASGTRLPPNLWDSILDLSGKERGNGLAALVLRRLGLMTERSPELWNFYVESALLHLDSKAIMPRHLRYQLSWLGEFEPRGVVLPPRMRLLWLSIQLAEANHLGKIGLARGMERTIQEFAKLESELYEEDAPLCCYADLNLAVAMTNEFDFASAYRLLVKWAGKDPAIPGLRYHAQVLSSLGQHAAFMRDMREPFPPRVDETTFGARLLARIGEIAGMVIPSRGFSRLPKSSAGLLDMALDELARLSWEKERERELDQTRSYAAIVAMDSKASDAESRLLEYLTGKPDMGDGALESAARRLAVSREPLDKFHHHVLLRYLVALPENHPARTAYLSLRKKWVSELDNQGHPWELIAFYRAMLLPEGEERVNAMIDVIKSALKMENEGPTILFIAVTLMGAMFAYCGNPDGEQMYVNYVAKCEKLLPLIPARIFDTMRRQPAARLPPLKFISAVLPFNFR